MCTTLNKWSKKQIIEIILFPSAPIFGRSLEEDVKIKDYIYVQPVTAKWFVRINRNYWKIFFKYFNFYVKGATLIFLPIFLQTSSLLYYTDLNNFNPDDFLSNACDSQHHPYTYYIPFSGGLRNCVGGKYAIVLQIKTVLL